MARARKPLTRRRLFFRAVVALALTVAACPAWYGLSGRRDLPVTPSRDSLGMDVFHAAEGDERIVLSSVYTDAPDGTDIVREIPDGASLEFKHLSSVVNLSIGVWIDPSPSGTRRILGASLKHSMQVRMMAWHRVSPDDALGYWREFARRLETTTALDRPALQDAGWPSPNLPPMSSRHVGRALRQAIDRNPAQFTGNMHPHSTRVQTRVEYYSWASIRWLGVRLMLAVACAAGFVIAGVAVVRLRRLRHASSPWCPGCQYSLDDGMPQCPECGMAIRRARGGVNG